MLQNLWLNKIWTLKKFNAYCDRILYVKGGKIFLNFFYPSYTKLCHNMHWFFLKFVSDLANKFCSISYNSNSIAIKTLCTPPWHQWHALLTKNSWNYFHFLLGKFFCKMDWVLSKYTSYIATKSCSKSYQLNSFAIKTLTTPSGHHSLSSCTIL